MFAYCWRLLFVVLFSTINFVYSFGQINSNLSSKSNINKKDSTLMNKDSVVVAIKLKAVRFSLNNIFDTLSVEDTLLSDEFPYFNQLDSKDYPIIDNGYIGSSAMPIVGNSYTTGFKLGMDQYDLYNIENKYFHISNVALTTLYFSPGALSTPNEFSTKAKFSKNFKDVALNINYARISNIGKYKSQDNKHTNLDFGLWKGSMNSRYNTFFNILVNVHEESHNGGVEEIGKLYLGGGYQYRQTIPVNLNEAKTRFDNYTISTTEYYKISNNNKKYFGFRPYFVGNVDIAKGFYKYFDVETNGDSLVYKALLVDKSGLRNYLKYSSIKANFGLFGVNSTNRFVKIGLDFRRTVYNHEPLGDIGVNQFFLYSKFEFTPIEQLRLKWDSKYHLGDFKGDYVLDLHADYISKYFGLQGVIKKGLYSPSFYDNNLWLSRILVYTNDFNKINELILATGISFDWLGLSARFEKHLIDNYIYYDNRLLPKQLGGILEYSELHINEKLKLSIFHFDNNLFLFKSSSDKKPLPPYTLRSKFYITPFLFQHHLLLNTGFEFNYWGKYSNYGFNPVLGKYYVQNDIELSNYNRLDFYMSAKIDEFLFYVRFNNILFNSSILQEKLNIPFKVINYPQSDMFFRLGVQWTLVQ